MIDAMLCVRNLDESYIMPICYAAIASLSIAQLATAWLLLFQGTHDETYPSHCVQMIQTQSLAGPAVEILLLKKPCVLSPVGRSEGASWP